jgi:hypothetical protein
VSVDRGSRNASELDRLTGRKKWLLFEGIQNCVVNNGCRCFVGGFMRIRWEVPLAKIVGDRGVANRIGAEHSNKFVVDDLGRELLHREKQAD